MQLSPDGTALGTCSWDGTLRVKQIDFKLHVITIKILFLHSIADLGMTSFQSIQVWYCVCYYSRHDVLIITVCYFQIGNVAFILKDILNFFIYNHHSVYP